jgi:hypothetical protein
MLRREDLIMMFTVSVVMITVVTGLICTSIESYGKHVSKCCKQCECERGK